MPTEPRYFEQAHNRDCDYQRERDEELRNHLSRSTWVRLCRGARSLEPAELPVRERCLRRSLNGGRALGSIDAYARQLL